LRELTPRIARHGRSIHAVQRPGLWPLRHPLFFVERKPVRPRQLADEDLSIDFASTTTPRDKVAVWSPRADHQRAMDRVRAGELRCS